MSGIEHPKSNWRVVNEMSTALDLHPWIVERALLWLHEAVEHTGQSWESIVSWPFHPLTGERRSVAQLISINFALKFLDLREAEREELMEIPIDTAHERLKVGLIFPANWAQRFGFGIYQKRFEEEVKNWQL